jgi:hypothetical protein
MGRKSKIPRRDQRNAVLRLLRGDESCAALACAYQVSDQTIYRWKKQFLADKEDGLPETESDGTVSKPSGKPIHVYHCLLDSFLRQCPLCGSHMIADFSKQRTVLIPYEDGELHNKEGAKLHLTSRIRRCHNPKCSRFLKPYRPEIEGRIALPRQNISLPLLAHMEYLRTHGENPRTSQASLSSRGINVTHTAIRNALARMYANSASACVSFHVTDFLDECSSLPCLLLDVFPWRRSRGGRSGWIVRDCFTGRMLLSRYPYPYQLDDIISDSPIPLLGVLYSTISTVSNPYRWRELSVHTSGCVTPASLKNLPTGLQHTLGLPVRFSRFLPAS